MRIIRLLKKINKRIKGPTTEDLVLLGYLEEVKDTYKRLSKEISSETLDFTSVKCYFRHLPIQNKHLGHLKETYTIANKCHEMLYNYCKQKHFIEDEITFDEYLNGFNKEK